ncbi:MAG: ZIP family metal transporter [Bacilli bacterium]
MSIINSFILTSLSGIATMIGYLVIFLPYKYKNKIIISSLSFAAGVMLIVSFLDLIPESFILIKGDIIIKVLLIIVFIIVGLIISSYLDKTIPNNNYLYKVGLVSLFSIILHNIPEGMITFISSTNNVSLGLKISLAITLHNIPEGISIAVPLYYATKDKYKVFNLLLLSALSEPIGALLALILRPVINSSILGFIYAFIAGLMFYIALYELLPASIKYKRYLYTIFSFCIGVLIMILSNILIK